MRSWSSPGLVQIRRDGGLLRFAAPPPVRTGALDEEFLLRIVAAFDIDRSDVLAHQWVDNGPGWAVLRLPTAQHVLTLEPDLSLIPSAMVGAVGAYPDGLHHVLRDPHLRTRSRRSRRSRLR